MNIPFSVAEKRLIFCVLGKIAKHNKNHLSQKHLDTIFLQLYKDASEEVKSIVMIYKFNCKTIYQFPRTNNSHDIIILYTV